MAKDWHTSEKILDLKESAKSKGNLEFKSESISSSFNRADEV